MRPLAHSPQTTVGSIERDLPATAQTPATAALDPSGRSASPDTKDAGLSQAIDRINKSLSDANQGIEFSVDPDSERVIVKVVDRETKEVLRQMPSQEALDIAKALDRSQGLLIKLKA
ncbi:hypothetical protein AB595_06200 [Massilia sp. WF1]|nr:hypothetical protein AB595_06200 [Massilia sp. WF1]